MPEVDVSIYANMSGAELQQERQKVLDRNKGTPYSDWDIDELSTLAAVVSVLRRKASGPPKEAKNGVRQPRAQKQKASLADLV